MTHSYRDEIGIFMERIRFVIFVKCLCEFSLSLELRLDGCNLFLHLKPEIELQSCHVLARSVVDLFVKMPLDEELFMPSLLSKIFPFLLRINFS